MKQTMEQQVREKIAQVVKGVNGYLKDHDQTEQEYMQARTDATKRIIALFVDADQALDQIIEDVQGQIKPFYLNYINPRDWTSSNEIKLLCYDEQRPLMVYPIALDEKLVEITKSNMVLVKSPRQHLVIHQNLDLVIGYPGLYTHKRDQLVTAPIEALQQQIENFNVYMEDLALLEQNVRQKVGIKIGKNVVSLERVTHLAEVREMAYATVLELVERYQK